LLALPAESIPKGTEKHNGAPIIFFVTFWRRWKSATALVNLFHVLSLAHNPISCPGVSDVRMGPTTYT
jgi:hypothetical protein